MAHYSGKTDKLRPPLSESVRVDCLSPSLKVAFASYPRNRLNLAMTAKQSLFNAGIAASEIPPRNDVGGGSPSFRRRFGFAPSLRRRSGFVITSVRKNIKAKYLHLPAHAKRSHACR